MNALLDFPVSDAVKTDFDAGIDTSSKGRAWVLRFKPDEDLVSGLLEFAVEQGVTRLQVIGAVGSLMHATLVCAEGATVRIDGPGVEIISLCGQIDTRMPESAQVDELRMVVADTQGQVHSGRPAPGGNPICVTIELFVQDCG